MHALNSGFLFFWLLPVRISIFHTPKEIRLTELIVGSVFFCKKRIVQTEVG